MEIRLQIPNIPTTTRYNPLNAVIADDGQIWTGGVLRDVCDWFARVTQLTESLAESYSAPGSILAEESWTLMELPASPAATPPAFQRMVVAVDREFVK